MSAAIGAFVAHLVFWVLLVYGWFSDDIGPRGIALFLTLWLGGLIGLRFVAQGGILFPSLVALLDIALVFLIFKGDVRLT